MKSKIGKEILVDSIQILWNLGGFFSFFYFTIVFKTRENGGDMKIQRIQNNFPF